MKHSRSGRAIALLAGLALGNSFLLGLTQTHEAYAQESNPPLTQEHELNSSASSASSTLSSSQNTETSQATDHTATQASTQANTQGAFELNGTRYQSLYEAFDASKGMQNAQIMVDEGEYELSSEYRFTSEHNLQLSSKGPVSFKRKAAYTGALFTLKSGSQLSIKQTDESKPIRFEGNEQSNDSWPFILVEKNAQINLEGKISFSNMQGSRYDSSALHNSGTAIIKGLSFDQLSSRFGGALYNAASGRMEISNAQFSNTRSTRSGGAIQNLGQLSVRSSSFNNSQASDTGGAINTEQRGNTSLEDVRFLDSIQDKRGAFALSISSPASSLELTSAVRFNNQQGIALMDTGSLTLRDASSYSSSTPLFVQVFNAKPRQKILQYQSASGADTLKDILPVLKITGTTIKISEHEPNSLVSLDSNEAQEIEIISNPYQDSLGLSLKENFTTDEARHSLKAQVERIYQFNPQQAEYKNYLLAEIDRLGQMHNYLSQHQDLAQASTIIAEGKGHRNKDAALRQFSFPLDYRTFTGLALVPSTSSLPQANHAEKSKAQGIISLEVFLDVDQNKDPSYYKNKVELAWRMVGSADGNSYKELDLRNRILKPGYNRISIDVSDKTKPFALYVRNTLEGEAVKVRIQALDAHLSQTQEAARPSQAHSASPAFIGSQLALYPSYEYDAKRPELFWDYIQYARQSQINMADTRFGKQDLSSSLASVKLAYQDIQTEEQAIAKAREIYKNWKYRIDALMSFDGYDLEESYTDPNSLTTQQIVTITDPVVTSPSSLYAYYFYYHMPENSGTRFLRGDMSEIMSWGHNHELGHQMDNNKIVQEEMTNNVYSIAAVLAGARYNLEHNRDIIPYERALHPNARRAENRNEAYMNRVLQGLVEDPSALPENGSQGFNWNNGGIWTQTLSIFNAFDFFSKLDYSSYPFESSSYTQEQNEERKKYGAWGAAMRKMRSDPQFFESLSSGRSHNNKTNRIIAMLSYSSGYNVAPYFEAMGFKDIKPEVQSFVSQYKQAPQEIFYASVQDSIKQMQISQKIARGQAEQINYDPGELQLSFEQDRKILDLSQGDKPVENKELIIRVRAAKASDSLSLYVFKHKDQLLGYSKNPILRLQNTKDLDLSAIKVEALDHAHKPAANRIAASRLTAAKIIERIPAIKLEPAKTWERIPAIELTPARTIERIPATPLQAATIIENSSTIEPNHKLTTGISKPTESSETTETAGTTVKNQPSTEQAPTATSSHRGAEHIALVERISLAERSGSAPARARDGQTKITSARQSSTATQSQENKSSVASQELQSEKAEAQADKTQTQEAQTQDHSKQDSAAKNTESKSSQDALESLKEEERKAKPWVIFAALFTVIAGTGAGALAFFKKRATGTKISDN